MATASVKKRKPTSTGGVTASSVGKKVSKTTAAKRASSSKSAAVVPEVAAPALDIDVTDGSAEAQAVLELGGSGPVSKNAAAEAHAVLRQLGEHVDTRRGGDEMLVDEEGHHAVYDEPEEDEDEAAAVPETRALAAAIPAASVEQLAAQVATGQHGAAGTSSNLFLGHNRNSVTAVATRDNAIVYADKLGVVTKITLASASSSADPVREMLLPHIDAPVLSLAMSSTSGASRSQGANRTTADVSVTSFIVAGAATGVVRVWRTDTLEHVGDLKLHRAPVTSLVFRINTSVLVSASLDKVVRTWSIHSMTPIDRYFGHQSGINAISALRADRAVSVGEDRVPRVWKLDRATQVSYKALPSAGDAVTLLEDDCFLVGCRCGSLVLYDTAKRTPVWEQAFTHGYGWGGDGTGLERQQRSHEDRFGFAEPPASAIVPAADGSAGAPVAAFGNGITAMASVPYSDLVATGSYDGYVRIWRYSTGDNERFKQRSLALVGRAPVFGFVNSLAFAFDGREIVCGIGKESRFGRWLVQRAARNGVQRVPLTETGAGVQKTTVVQPKLPAPTPVEDDRAIEAMLRAAKKPSQRSVELRRNKKRDEGTKRVGSKKKG